MKLLPFRFDFSFLLVKSLDLATINVLDDRVVVFHLSMRFIDLPDVVLVVCIEFGQALLEDRGYLLHLVIVLASELLVQLV